MKLVITNAYRTTTYTTSPVTVHELDMTLLVVLANGEVVFGETSLYDAIERSIFRSVWGVSLVALFGDDDKVVAKATYARQDECSIITNDEWYAIWIDDDAARRQLAKYLYHKYMDSEEGV